MQKSIPVHSEKISFIRNRTARYSKLEGRRPRILITRLPSNGPEQAVKRIAAAFADMGFDVDINLCVQAPVVLARIAAENDVHAIGISCISFGSTNFLAELSTSLKTECGPNILVVAWMAVQSEGFNTSFESGDRNFRIFGPEIDYHDCAGQILDNLEGNFKNRNRTDH